MDTDTKPQNQPKELTPKQRTVDALKNATNVLVTISTNPSVDQLASCIGLTLMLNKLGKHATAVFSGAIPSTLEFLEPEKTIEQTTDSLRDFIISLDKSKADKLRYKVEDDVVRIYITPYRTSISQADLDFTQGDFNVDVVVALGIQNKDQLDAAIIEHGQILHDAVVIDLSCGAGTPVEMGAINWHEPTASSLSEMLVSISESFQTGLLDTQMSTAFLTGIVAETERFSNDKTTPKVMTMSAQLMAAGANQQLIANQLAIKPEPEPEALAPMPEEPARDPGELVVQREEEPQSVSVDAIEQGSGENGLSFDVREQEMPVQPEPTEPDLPVVDANNAQDILGTSGSDVTDTSNPAVDQQPSEHAAAPIEIDEHGRMVDLQAQAVESEYAAQHQKRVIQPLNQPPEAPKTDLSTVQLEDQPAAPPVPTQIEEVVTPGQPADQPEVQSVPPEIPLPAPVEQAPQSGEQTLEDLERAVNSPHLQQVDPSQAAQAAMDAANDASNIPNPADHVPEDDQLPPPPAVPPPLPPFNQ